jgi:hypothetical protein
MCETSWDGLAWRRMALTVECSSMEWNRITFSLMHCSIVAMVLLCLRLANPVVWTSAHLAYGAMVLRRRVLHSPVS